tara:strand:- start:7 stop:171 length:165 start_codon:yes stop_codon:yes gene_type:complete
LYKFKLLLLLLPLLEDEESEGHHLLKHNAGIKNNGAGINTKKIVKEEEAEVILC